MTPDILNKLGQVLGPQLLTTCEVSLCGWSKVLILYEFEQDIWVINKKKMTFPNSCPGKSTWQESSSTSTWSQTLKSWSWPYTGPSFKAPHQRCIWTPWPGPSSSMGGLATNSPTSWRWCRSTGWGPRRSIFRSKLALVSLLPLVLFCPTSSRTGAHPCSGSPCTWWSTGWISHSRSPSQGRRPGSLNCTDFNLIEM